MKTLLTKLGRLFSKRKTVVTIAGNDLRASLKADGFGIYDKDCYPPVVWEDLPLRQKHIEIEKTNKATRNASDAQAGYCREIIRINVAGNLIVRY